VSLNDYLRPEQGVEAEMFVAPSKEAQFLLKHVPWLVSPPDKSGSALSRFIRMTMVAPFTQMTFVSFDLQAFLFGVFHQSIVAQTGHFLFMVAVNFFLMVGLSSFDVGPITAAHVFTAGLLLWYGVVARSVGLWAWFLVSVLCTAALFPASPAYCGAFLIPGAPWYAPSPLAANPWLGMAASAFLIAMSHAPEPMLPPRAAEKLVWRSVPSFVFGPPGQRHSIARIALNGGRTAMFTVWGTLDEWWASPRLMPYNFLMVMFRFGYAPARRAELQRHVQRALASGNPALDYVGIGGGTFMQLPADAPTE